MRQTNIIAFPKKAEPCHHKNISFDHTGTQLSCEDCHEKVNPAWAFDQLEKQHQRKEANLEAKRNYLETLTKKTLDNQAAKKLQTILKNDMIPCCPHCDKGLSPKDILNAKQTHKENQTKNTTYG